MNREELQKYIANIHVGIVDAMKLIDVNASGILFIVDDNDQLVGSLTDGDIRRWIIRTGDLSVSTSRVMHTNVHYLLEDEIDSGQIQMKQYSITAMPVVDDKKSILDIIFKSNDSEKNFVCNKMLNDVPVIVMAGGKGTRLYPYTKILPKPLIPIGDIPILERILSRFNECGAKEFFITVNYRKEMIKSYFNELNPPYRINYVEEDKPLGTAGSIRLIKKKFNTPVLITNCDILIEANYADIIEYHNKSGNQLTIVSSVKNMTIPYGVIHSKEDGLVASMDEKPQLSFLINTGMYVISPEYIERIPKNTFYHMTNLAEALIAEGAKVGMYPISENSFLDMGQFEEMKKMEDKISKNI